MPSMMVSLCWFLTFSTSVDMTMENIFVDWQMFKRWRLSHWHLLSLLIINDIKASQIYRMKKKIVPNIKHILYVWLWLISIFLLTPSIIFSNTNKAMRKMESTVQGRYLQMNAAIPVAKSLLEPVSNFEAVWSLLKRWSSFFSEID